MSTSQIRKQSEAVIRQFGEKWEKHAKENAKYAKKSIECFRDCGVGRAVLCIANGYSFEHELETIKKYQDNVDILCCDKTLGPLLDHGITPTFCVVADANVSYEKYMEKWKDKLDKTILFMNVCANPKWAQNGNWKDMYFTVNKDVLGSEKKFGELSGCPNGIAAATNVSGAMVVLLTQSDENGRQNFFGYDKILLIGFDYSWSDKESYYAFDKYGGGKAHYMRHQLTVREDGEFCYSSGNLLFSAKWLAKYITTFNLPVIQCTKKTILSTSRKSTLEKQMQYMFDPEDAKVKNTLNNLLTQARNQMFLISRELDRINRKHDLKFLETT